jgi:MFS family permease
MGLSAASILATWILLPVTRGSTGGANRFTLLDWKTYGGYFQRPALGPLLWQFFAFIFAFSFFMSGFPLFAERRFTHDGRPFGPREVGYVYAYVGFLGIILQGGLIGHLVRWFGDWGLVRYGFLVGVAGFIALGWTYGLVPLLFVGALIAFGTGVLRPALTSLITQFADRSEQGGVLGLTQSLQALAQITAPVLGGILIDHNLLKTWSCAAAASLFVGLLMRRSGRQRAHTETPAEAPSAADGR